MNSTIRDARPIFLRTSLAIFAVTLGLAGPARSQVTPRSDGFRVQSATFENNTTLPPSAVDNITINGSNVCSLGGAPGGNQSPQLSWSHPPRATHSFAVIVFDTTASFSHWGIYNISGDATGLPENAGVAASTYGTEVVNDFGDARYDGPCPPTNLLRTSTITFSPFTPCARSSACRRRRISPQTSRRCSTPYSMRRCAARFWAARA